jgi:hypothetical protein
VKSQLRLIHGASGEGRDGCPQCEAKDGLVDELSSKLNGALSELGKLTKRLARAQGVDPEAEDIRDVLGFWRVRCMPAAKIVVGSERWENVAGLLAMKNAAGGKCYTPLSLKAAVTGALLSEWHVENRRLDIFAVADKRLVSSIDKHIERAVGFKRRTGVSALTVVDELAGEGVAWLAERCECGHLWIEHLRGGARTDGSQPCATCGCSNFGQSLDERVEQWMREQAAGHGPDGEGPAGDAADEQRGAE